MRTPSVYACHRHLLRQHGPQYWWPADTAFEVMVGAILTQNTAWTNVERAIDNLDRQGLLDPQRILAADPKALGDWLRPSGYFNIKARRLRNFCQWYVDNGGYAALNTLDTPTLRTRLLAVNGIGPETADDILLYAFDRPVFVIDAYTRRIFSRLGLVAADSGYEALRSWFEATLTRSLSRVVRASGRHDLQLQVYNELHALIVVHAKDICRPRPACAQCCLRRHCQYPRQNDR
jgi:endonuclease-3 related protein